MQKIFMGLIVLALLTGCGAPVIMTATPRPVTPTIEPTETLVPTATWTPEPTKTTPPTEMPLPTPVPLDSLDLRPMIVVSGDLPAGYGVGQIRDVAGSPFESKNLPKAEQVFYQQIGINGGLGGYVIVWLFKAQDDIVAAYKKISGVPGKGALAVNNIGEEAVATDLAGDHYDIAREFVFRRCNAVVYIILPLEPDAMTAYAKHLDKRLATLCTP